MRSMHPSWLPVLLLIACIPAPARASHDIVLRDETASFPLAGARTLRIDVPVGEVHVDATTGDRIEARLKLSCNRSSSRCRERAAALHLSPRRGADGLTLKMEGYDRDGKRGFNHPDVELRLQVPAALGVSVDMGVGELDLAGIEGDVTVDIGVGEARLEVPERAVHAVALDVGVGEARLSPRPADSHREGFLFLGNEVDWKGGAGVSRVAVDIGVGEASVRLVP